jgi:hypothetical protein
MDCNTPKWRNWRQMASGRWHNRGNGGAVLQPTPGDGQACASRHSRGKAAVRQTRRSHRPPFTRVPCLHCLVQRPLILPCTAGRAAATFMRAHSVLERPCQQRRDFGVPAGCINLPAAGRLMVGACRGLNKQPPHHALCKRYMWPSKQWYRQQYMHRTHPAQAEAGLGGQPAARFPAGPPPAGAAPLPLHVPPRQRTPRPTGLPVWPARGGGGWCERCDGW